MIPFDVIHHSSSYTATHSPVRTLLIILAVLVVLLVVTALQHRRHAAATANRLCRACGESHPPHARFCRRCGTAMGQ
jgi:hypothetical protein